MTIPSGAVATARLSFWSGSGNTWWAMAVSFSFGPQLWVGHGFTGPLMLDPNALLFLQIATPGPLPNWTPPGWCTSDYGIEYATAVQLPPGTVFGLQGVAGFEQMFSPLMLVHVQ